MTFKKRNGLEVMNKIKKFIWRLVVILVAISLLLGTYSVCYHVHITKKYREQFEIYKESFDGLAKRMIELKAEHGATKVEFWKFYSSEPLYFEVLHRSKVNPMEYNPTEYQRQLERELLDEIVPKMYSFTNIYLTEDEIQWQENLEEVYINRIIYDEKENIIFGTDGNYYGFAYVVDDKSARLLTSQYNIFQASTITRYNLGDNWYLFDGRGFASWLY